MSGKLLLWDFHCDPCDYTFEEFAPSATGHSPVTCPKCGLNANRQLAAPRIDPRLGVSSDFGTMADRWAKVRRQRQKHVEKLHRDHGDIR
jgi:putative FmdB family regulatory protein